MKLDKILRSQARKKIVHFFHLNPTSVDSPSGIVTWTGLAAKEAAQALEELAKAGILVAHRSTSTVGYAYTRNKKLIEKIKKYFMD